MATLTVTATEDFSDGSPPLVAGTTSIIFNTTGSTIATFGSNQLDGDPISTNVAITGDSFNDTIRVNLSATGTFSAAGWTFTNWSANDRVEFGDTTGNDTITGSVQGDDFIGGSGADVLNGGGGNDTFNYFAATNVVAGEVVDGGAGTDTLRFLNPDTFDFRSATLTSIERFEFTSQTGESRATFNANQFGGAGISNALQLVGSADADRVEVHLSAPGTFSAAGWSLTNWFDILDVFGSSGADTITGSSFNDQIRTGGGADSIDAGAGVDNLIVSSIVAGMVLNGGIGDDLVNLATSNVVYDFSLATVIAIESLTLNNRTNATAILGGNQIGVAGGITQVSSTPGDRVQALIVNASSDVDLSAVTFTGWDSPNKTITINGTAADDSLTGSAQNDTFFAGAGADTLNGGGGDDTLVGNGGGADTFTATQDSFSGGNGSDTLYVKAGDIINGGTGRDFVHLVNDNPININLGSTGIEWIETMFGSDVIDGSTQTVGIEVYSDGGNDTITGSAFADLIFSGSGNDTVTGGDGADVIVGDVGADSISGGNGNDSLYIDPSDTFIDGGANFDAAYITSGSGISLNLATSHLEWVADFAGGNDTIDGSGVTANMEVYAAGGTDNITGGTGADFLWGGSGNDTITGNSGNDTLVGEDGVDRLTGGAGTDTLYGSTGGGGDGAVDTFVFGDGWGTDFVFDFVHNGDKLDMTAVSGLDNFSQLTLTNTSDGHCYVTFAGNLIAVANMAGQLTASDFLL